MSDVFDYLIKRAKKIKNKTIVFPEGDEPRIVGAVNRLVADNMCKAIVLGKVTKLKKMYTPSENISIIDPAEKTDLQENLATKLYELRKHKGLTQEQAFGIITDRNYFATMLLSAGLADGVVSGAVTKSGDVMRPAFQIIKQKPNLLGASSCFIMEVPENKRKTIGEKGLIVFSDCGTIINPDAKMLSSIALSAIETAEKVLGITPLVSMLSFTTKDNSSTDPEVLKVKEATNLVKSLRPDLIIEGEVQADSALNKIVSKTKNSDSKICGRSNVLIFPNLMAGNIGYKLVQQFCGTRAVGPIMQGLNKPVNDLSRGANEDEIYLTVVITLLQM